MFQVKDWSKFQHYKPKNPNEKPKWIKLYTRILDDFEFQSLPIEAQALLPQLWLLASETNGVLKDYESVSFRLRKDSVKLEKTVKLLIEKGFLINSRLPLEQLYSNSIPEDIEKKERREDKEADCTSDFHLFWKQYPQREGSNPKKPAQDKFISAVKAGTDPKIIIKGAQGYQEQMRAAGNLKTKFIAQAVTWLNQERWKDDYKPRESKNGYLGM